MGKTICSAPESGLPVHVADSAGGRKRMALHGLAIPRERLEAFCLANGIRRLALFGSILRDDYRPDSDVDVLVEFQPGVRVGLASRDSLAGAHRYP